MRIMSGGIFAIPFFDIVIFNQKNETIIEAWKQRRLYFVPHNIVYESYEASTLEVSGEFDLWHQRFCHLSKKTIPKMANKQLVDGLPRLKLEKPPFGKHIDCQFCAMGKQARTPFVPRSFRRASAVGHRLHVDIAGPTGEPTFSKADYFVLLKDEYSAYRLIYFIRTKDQAFECVKRAIVQVEADTKSKVRMLISDCGSEFLSNKMKAYLLERGVAQEVSAPATPEQNGVIERDNRTVMEAARSMLYAENAPNYLWGKAANTAVYTLNRSINRTSGDKTPYELYFQRKPRVNHLRIFGSLAFVKEQEKKRRGLYSK